jgi:hypothetical protein
MIVEKEIYIIMYSIFFNYYEQSMAKWKLKVNYYNNIYQGCHERWWAMSTITQGEGKLKEVIIIDMAQRRLRQLSNFGWFIVQYLYIA